MMLLVPMLVTMVLSGFLSTMNVFADKCSDIYLSLNDLYMSMLMSGWMMLFMGFVQADMHYVSVGLVLVVAGFVAIRTQFLIGEKQYLKGMIPHHSMAVFMSKKLQEKGANNIGGLLETIIASQNSEIDYMKAKLD
jgi:hypothetical protein